MIIRAGDYSRLRSFEHSDKNRIAAILRAARRRRALILALEQSATTVALVLAGAILMLLLGTQILAWYWLALLAAVGFASTLLRRRSPRITSYRLAQILDHRLKLSDSLSTAWFLLSESRGDDPISRLQIERAGKLAGSVRFAGAFPITGRRSWVVSASLAVLAVSLFGVRYLATDTLSLKPPLVALQFGPLLQALERPFTSEVPKVTDPESEDASQVTSQEQHGGNISSERLGQAARRNSGPQAAAAAENRPSASEATQNDAGKQAGTSSGIQSTRQAENSGKTAPDSAHASEQASMQPDDSGLLGNLKDALSSLLAKLRSNASSAKSASHSERSAQAQTSAEQSALGKGREGAQQKAQGDSSSEQQSAAGQAQGETAEKTQASQARNASGASQNQGSDKQSGIGRQDGDKEVKEAEQLRAMGKLAEIIGKRSANVTGDMTVETSSHNQALKTEYSQRLGRHSDSGGEIDRDEIPPAYEQYVRDYMQEARKQQIETPARNPE